MENRDRDNVSSSSSGIDKKSSESEASFGKNIGRSEDLNSEPSRRSGSVGSSGMQGDSRNRSSSIGSEMEQSSSRTSKLDSESLKKDSGRGSQGSEH